MNNSVLYRSGGIAVFAALLLSLGSSLAPFLLALGTLALALFVFALYRYFSPVAPQLSLAGAILGVGGALLLAALLLAAGSQNNAIQNSAIWAAWFAPPLIFGWIAFRHGAPGTSRNLGPIGFLGGVAGVVNLLATLASGGDWSNPSNPALGTLIMGAYFVATLLTLAWMIWSGVMLIRAGAAPQQQPAA